MKNRVWNDITLETAIKSGDGSETNLALGYIFETFNANLYDSMEKIGAKEEEVDVVLARAFVKIVQRLNYKKFTLKSSIKDLYINIVTDEWVIDGLRKETGQHRDKAFIFVEKDWLPTAKKEVRNLGGSETDAEEVFELASWDVQKWVMKPESALYYSSLNNYFSTAVKHAYWRLKRTGKHLLDTDIDTLFIKTEENSVDDISAIMQDENEKIKLLATVKKLADKCKTLLTHYYNGIDMNKITEIMGYSDKDVTKSRKCKCMARLMKLLPADLALKFKPKKGRPLK